jgi:hypothetical protein
LEFLQLGLANEVTDPLRYDKCAQATAPFRRREIRQFECIGQGWALVLQLKAPVANLTLCEVEVYNRFAGQCEKLTFKLTIRSFLEECSGTISMYCVCVSESAQSGHTNARTFAAHALSGSYLRGSGSRRPDARNYTLVTGQGIPIHGRIRIGSNDTSHSLGDSTGSKYVPISNIATEKSRNLLVDQVSSLPRDAGVGWRTPSRELVLWGNGLQNG